MNIQQLFILFIIYSFMGWIGEVIYCSIPEKHFVNRGFLHGPICPVYGVGGILVVFLLAPFKDTWIELFFAATFVTTVLEYFTSWIMEILFHNRWWDYSQFKFNINGRVCLLNSLIFGVAGTLALRFVHPPIEYFIKSIKSPIIEIVAIVLAMLFITDLIITVRSLKSFNKKLKELKDFSITLRERFTGESWFEYENIRDMFKSLKQRAKEETTPIISSFIERLELLNKKSKSMLRILNAFPKIKSPIYSEQLEHFKLQLKIAIELKREEIKSNYARKKGLPYEAVSKEEIIKKIENQKK